MQITRRTMLKAGGAAIAVNVFHLPSLTQAAQTNTTSPPPGWSGPPGQARYRIDGFAKVTGEKVYARDYHAWDMDGWPDREKPVLILRAFHADRPFRGLNLGMLPPDLQPSRVITGNVLEETSFKKPEGGGYDAVMDRKSPNDTSIQNPSDIVYDFIVVPGEVPAFLGQAVAFLIFEDRKSYRGAKKLLQFNPDAQVYGAQSKPLPDVDFKPLTNYVRIAESPTKDLFSYAKNGGEKDYTKQAEKYRALIEKDIADSDWTVYKNQYSMRAMDPMFMEPETGLGWYDASTRTLNLVVGTQSPDHDISDSLELFTSPDPPVPVDTVNLYSCYPGGGFGGRDKSVFTLNLAIAAAYANGVPVRIANDRFEQFQAGLKRHAATLNETLAVDKNGIIQALVTDMDFDGGGRKNLSPYVAQLASLCAGGAYVIPKSAINARAHHSVNISGGSQRGFGGPQAFFAIETTLDEAASDLGIDPIDLRYQNLLQQGDHTVVGGPVNEALRLVEICEKARNNPVWTDWAPLKKAYADKGLLYGTGFALSMQAYGTSGDGMLGAIRLEKDGTLTVTTNAVDMGNGSATTLAVVPGWTLGANAADIRMGDAAAFNALDMQSGGDTDWQNPRWTKKFSGSSSACLTAFHQVHAINQACLALFYTGILPAARKLHDVSLADAPDEAFRWEGGKLVADGLTGLDLATIAKQVYADGGFAEAMIHAYFQENWVEADYTVNDRTYRWAIDRLALFPAGSETPRQVDRKNGRYPAPVTARYSRTTFAPCGNLIGLTVDPHTGGVTVTSSVSILDAGNIITEGLLSGQSQGGVAMAVGYTLLEDMPPGLEGPANGEWNLNRYHVPLARDAAIHTQELEPLEPLLGDMTSKGIAEAVMCSVAPAIANAIYDATGVRFRDLPITAAKIREALAKS